MAALSAGDALLAFAAYDTTQGGSYAAFIARAGARVEILPLGRARVVDTAVERWTREVLRAPVSDRGAAAQGAERSCRRAGEHLRRLIWDPVAARLGPVSRVFLVPAGALYRVNFAALPAAGREYLADSGPLFHVLSSERDLVPAAPEPAPGHGLLALGGLSFDQRGADSSAEEGRSLPASSARRGPGNVGALPDCPDFRTVRFEPLPASAREAEEVARLWPDPSSAVVLTGVRATEFALKKLAPGTRVLHLATHGFFLDGSRCSMRPGRRGIGGVSTGSPVVPRPASARHAQARHASPLRLSGLALAGANRRDEARPGEEDGILTAEEVASIDLGGVEWVVLSGCDTGVGRAQTGEGVLGLRRAFQIAGARTVIMSLWSVDDQAARRWMKALYEGRIRHSLGTAEAVREADRSVLREQRAQGRSTHPLYWAGFVAAGDWR